MKSVAALVVLVCAAPAVMAQLMVNSLNDVVACQPAQITWQGGAPPYFVSLIPAGQPSAPAIKQFSQQEGNSLTWTVDIPAGTSFTTALKDASGAVVYSGEQTVMSGGSDTSCMSSMSGSVAMSVTSSSSTTSMLPTSLESSQAGAFAASTSVSSGVATASRSASANATVSRSASSALATPTQSTRNDASRGYTTLGVVGLTGFLGLVGFAIF